MARDTIAPTQPATPSAPSLVDTAVPALDALGSDVRLELEELIGRGGMGEVRLVRDVKLGRQLAMKTSTTSDDEATHRFVREARVQGQLEHPGIVPVHELGLDADGRPFFTMKRVRGITLGEVLRDPTFPRRRLLTFLQMLARTLDFAHARGVVHRDVKPANVMLGDFGEVYLLDWGLAKLDAQEDTPVKREGESRPGVTVAGAVMGTPGYMAPEQASGRPATPASDVWALGVMLYESLTSTKLIDEKTFIDSIVATQKLENPSPRARKDDVSPELDALCVAALAHDATRRPTAREFAEKLDAILAGERDLELRVSLAGRHVQKAEVAAARALQNGSLDARREALREVGQALALDPGLSKAHDLFGRLLAVAPTELPPEVKHELDEAQRDNARVGIRNGLLANLSTGLLLVPTVFWVRDWRMFSATIALWLASTVLIALISRKKVATRADRLLGIGVVTLFNTSLALISGPFVILPAVATAYAMSMALWVPKKDRMYATTLQGLSLIVPLVLSHVGVLPKFYEQVEGGVLMRALMLDLGTPLWAPATLITLLATIASSTMAMVRTRQELEDARRQLSLQRWNLEQLRAAAPTRVTNDTR